MTKQDVCPVCADLKPEGLHICWDCWDNMEPKGRLRKLESLKKGE